MAIIGKLILVLLVRLPCLVCFTFTKEPQSPITVVLGHNTTNVYMEWKYEAQGSTVANIQLKRFLQSKDNSLSKETLLFYFAPGFAYWNRTLYVFSASWTTSGYANFTIKDVLKRLDNTDKTKVSYLSGEVYTYRLDVKTIRPSLAVTSITVDLQVYFPSKIIVFFCQGCQNGDSLENQTITLFCNATGKPMPNITWTKNGENFKAISNSVSNSYDKIVFPKFSLKDSGNYACVAINGIGNPERKTIALFVNYLDDLEVIGSSNQSYCQSNPVVLFNLNVNAYPSNTTTLSCRSSTPALTSITGHDAGLYTKHYMVFVLIKSTVGTGSIVCRAKHDAGVRERTLHFYKRPMFFKTPFRGQFIITNQNWQEELKDAKSAVYNDLRKKCIKIIKNAYSNLPYLADVNIKEFLKGSIIVRFELQIIGQVSDPLLPLKDYIKRQGGEMDGLQIDYNSIQKPSGLKDDSMVQTEEQQNKTLVVVLAVMFALAVFLNMIFIAIIIWLRRKDSKGGFGKRSKSREEIVGQINDIALQETSFNATENRPEDEPIGRRGLAASNAGIPEYEAVPTRTQPTQPLNNNPTPQYEIADRHILPGADSNIPPVTYQTIHPRTGDHYGSLSPSTRLPPKDTVLSPSGNPKRAREYEALHHKGVSPQYQSLDDLSRC